MDLFGCKEKTLVRNNWYESTNGQRGLLHWRLLTTCQRQYVICSDMTDASLVTGGVVVSVLATGPKGRGFKPGWGDGFLRVMKVRSTPSFAWEVKPEVPCHTILWHVKDPLTYQRYWIREILIPLSIPPARSTCLCWYDCQRALVDKSGVTPNQHHHHPWLSCSHSPGGWIGQRWPRFWAVSPHIINQSINRCITHSLMHTHPPTHTDTQAVNTHSNGKESYMPK
jgi:hypothetical protein